MVLNVSGRTDVVAFYSEWFKNRYKEGFVDVRNPFSYRRVSRIYFEDVDLIVFCTKNPEPIIDFLKEIKEPIIFQVTLTPYLRDIEPNVPDKHSVIESIKKVSEIVGKDNVYVRYDPVFLSDKYDLEYHVRALDKMCDLLHGFVKHIIISFIDDYKTVRKNMNILKYRTFNSNDYEVIGKHFYESAARNGISVQTCGEEVRLLEYGFIKEECVSASIYYKMTGKTSCKKWKARKNMNCECVQMVDVGEYNTCSHFCRYCYANYDEKMVLNNKLNHDVNSTLLIGQIESDMEITRRKV